MWPALTPRHSTVLTEDGVALDVEVHGPEAQSGTVVLLHGYELDQTLWARQVEALISNRPDQRVVTYDHRGHGRSGRTSREAATLAQLGRDLKTVLDTIEGPVTLVGHSMGGMTIMAYLDQHPEEVARIAGVGFVSTSSAGMGEVGFGLPPRLARAAPRIASALLPRFNALGTARESKGKPKPHQPGMKWLLFGQQPDRADVLRTKTALEGCPAATAEAFYWTFLDHDRTAALATLAAVPVLVACGDRDRLTPLAHSETIAAALPHATFVVYPGAGHMLMLERPDDVSRRLVELVATALPQAAQRVG